MFHLKDIELLPAVFRVGGYFCFPIVSAENATLCNSAAQSSHIRDHWALCPNSNPKFTSQSFLLADPKSATTLASFKIQQYNLKVG